MHALCASANSLEMNSAARAVLSRGTVEGTVEPLERLIRYVAIPWASAEGPEPRPRSGGEVSLSDVVSQVIAHPEHEGLPLLLVQVFTAC